VAKEKVVPLPGQGNKISAPVINMSYSHSLHVHNP